MNDNLIVVGGTVLILILFCIGSNFVLNSYSALMTNLNRALVREVKRCVRFRIEYFFVMFIPCLLVMLMTPGVESLSDKFLVTAILFALFFSFVFTLKVVTLFKKLNWATRINQYPYVIGHIVKVNRGENDLVCRLEIYGAAMVDNHLTGQYYIEGRALNGIKNLFSDMVIAFYDPDTHDAGASNIEFIAIFPPSKQRRVLSLF